jgi:hypothetical protein
LNDAHAHDEKNGGQGENTKQATQGLGFANAAAANHRNPVFVVIEPIHADAALPNARTKAQEEVDNRCRNHGDAK